MSKTSKKKKLLLIDSFALIFRAYYAYPPTLTTTDGSPINAVYGFTHLLLDVLSKFEPEYVVAVFDSDKPTIRKTEFADYKANRKETDNELLVQIPQVARLVGQFNIPLLEVGGYEADDVIGTLAKRYEDSEYETIIVTGDQDLFQLVDHDTFVYLASRKFSESKLFKEVDVREKLGIRPDQVVDLKAIQGDSSDNIPGVAGIGKKGATDLIQEFGDLDNIYENIENVANRYKNKLADGYEDAMNSQKLATIITDVPLSFDIAAAEFKDFDPQKVTDIFDEFRFRSLQGKFKKFLGKFEITHPEDQISMEEIMEGDSEKKDEYEDWKKAKIKKGEDIFAVFNFDNLEESCIHRELKDINFVIGSDAKKVYKVKADGVVEFIEMAIKQGINIISIDIKNLFHSLINLGFDISELNKLKFEDIGIMTRILSEGVFAFGLEDAFRFVGVRYPSKLETQLKHLREVYQKLRDKQSEENELMKVYQLEKDIIMSVAQMEQNGIAVDSELLHEFEKKLEAKRGKLMQQIYDDVGHEFNINSPKQVGEVLFIEKGLPGGKKTKSGGYSTNEQVLNDIIEVDPVIQMILNFREVSKLISTYARVLPEFVKKDGRIHADFDQMGAVSGRFSSKNPNMQNIPADTNGINMRNAFVSESKKYLVAFDYSQQELRILAALSGEEELLRGFEENVDIHRLTASNLFDKSLEKVSSVERGIGKTINFSVIYGISAFGLSQRMRIGRAEAKELIDKFFKEYPKVAEYFENLRKVAKTKRMTETVFGRRRLDEKIKSGHFALRNAAERELLNFVIQGTAADIMKIAMRNIQEFINDFDAKLLLQVHDEFVFEVGFDLKSKEYQDFDSKVKEAMDHSEVDLGINYKVDSKVGRRWGELE